MAAPETALDLEVLLHDRLQIDLEKYMEFTEDDGQLIIKLTKFIDKQKWGVIHGLVREWNGKYDANNRQWLIPKAPQQTKEQVNEESRELGFHKATEELTKPYEKMQEKIETKLEEDVKITEDETGLTELKIAEINLLKEVYPRDEFDNEIVNNYALNLDNLPPIVVSHEHILVDGYHRLLAHKLQEKDTIIAEVIECVKDAVLWEATKRNARHGLQLKRHEKQRLARHFYENNGTTLKEIGEVLGVSESTVSNWLRNLVEDAKEEQKRQIIELYLDARLTQEEIASKVGLSQQRVSQITNNFKSEEISKRDLIPESLQLFNVWNFSKRSTQYGLECEGAIPGQIIENILHYFTDPFDIIVDPMAGGGTTIDVCKTMFRRYMPYDLAPLREDITQHDSNNGFPKECNNCDLIFLDPPYYNMVFKDCFKDIDDFYNFIKQLAKNTFNTLKDEGIAAFLMQDMTELGNYCLSGECYRIFRDAGFKTIAHISVPLTTQQFLPQQVEKAKQDKHLLGRNRDLYIFRRP